MPASDCTVCDLCTRRPQNLIKTAVLISNLKKAGLMK
jgi:hypothetical protein